MGADPAGRPAGDTLRDGSGHAVKVLVIDDQPLQARHWGTFRAEHVDLPFIPEASSETDLARARH